MMASAPRRLRELSEVVCDVGRQSDVAVVLRADGHLLPFGRVVEAAAAVGECVAAPKETDQPITHCDERLLMIPLHTHKGHRQSDD